MSWSLSKPNVGLRVTKFAPRAVAGLSDEARAALQAKRQAECRKVKYPKWRREELARKYGGPDCDGR